MMRTIKDYPGYAEAETTLNELAAKRTGFEKELHAIEGQLGTTLPPGDVVADALAIKPGYSVNMPGPQDRARTLRAQLYQLDRAIDTHHVKVMALRRKACGRLFAENSTAWQKLAGELVSAVDQVAAVNKALALEASRLRRMGCEEMPDLQFPDYGLSEQLPTWRDDLQAQVKHAANMIKGNTHGQD